MALSSVERDLALMLFQSGGLQDLESKLTRIIGKSGVQGAKDFYEVMQEKQKELQNAQDRYASAYRKLKDVLTKYGFFDEEASAVISQMAKYDFSTMAPTNLAKDLFGITDINNLVAQEVNKVALEFLTQVNSYFDQIVDSNEFLSMVGEEIRGDKLLYAIAQTNKSKVSSLAFLGKEAYSELLKSNKHMFNLRIEDDGTVSELEVSKAGKFNMNTALSALANNESIINGVFSSVENGKNLVQNLMDRTIREDSKITYKDIWHQVKSTSNLLSAPSSVDNKQVILDMGRRFELFMQADFSKISGTDISDPTAIQDIQRIINSYNGKISMGENKAGIAGGDTDFTLPSGQRITIQDKVANNAHGWHGIGVNGLFNGFNFYIKDMPKLLSDVSAHPEQFANGQLITDYVTENYMGGASYEEQIYSTMGSLVMETLGSDPNFTTWLGEL